jgi:metal-sulfur cluster biosynthetic enzyme
VLAAFQEMAQGRGQVEPDEDVLGDGVAFAGVARYPARVKCALLGWMAFKDAVSRGVAAGDRESGSPRVRESSVREYSEGEHMSVEHRTEADDEVVRGAAGMPEPPAAPAAGEATDLDDLEEAMRDVVDPELGINVVDLGLVYGIAVDSRVATIDMTLTSAACPLTDVIEDQAHAALVSAGLVDDVRINWVWMPPWGPEKITDDGREQLRSLGFRV